MIKSNPSTPVWAIALAIVFPSVLTYAYFVALIDQSPAVRQVTYGVGKLAQFGFPALVVFAWLRQPTGWMTFDRRRQAVGLAFGLAVVGAMGCLYFAWLRHSPSLERLATTAVERTRGIGVDSFWEFIALGLFYSLVHSFLEEYYWRWFVYRGLKAHMPILAANIASSLGFMAHHVILLGAYFGWDSPLTYAFSAAVAIGGSFWAALYEEHQSLSAPWLSHALVDAGIFLIGYELVSRSW